MSEIKTSEWILVNSQKENVGMESSISPHTVKTAKKLRYTLSPESTLSLQKDTLMGHMRRLARFGTICTIQKT